MGFLSGSLESFDSEIFQAIRNETTRQNDGLELIPSENYVSPAVMEALGSTLTNKYSEGYAGKRYYGGNKYIDVVETIAIERAKQLFGAEHVNVQPYSGSPANLEAYSSVLNFGDKVMGLSLAHGGHLTHGHKVNFSGKAYNIVHYLVDEKTHLLDYDKIKKQALAEKPKLIVSGFTAYPRTVDFKAFAEIASEAGAVSMADISHISGLVIGKVHPSPFPFTDIVTTTTHKTLRGVRGAMIMCKEKYAVQVDKAVFPGMQGGPHNHTTAANAVAFKEAMTPEFAHYAAQIVKNAKALADELMAQGLKVITGGTDNHLVLVDVFSSKGIPGKDAEAALDEALITCNKNQVPYDTRSPFDPSGIRLGTPAITTRGMKESEMKEVGRLIAKVISNHTDASVKEKVRQEVVALTSKFPLYPL
ncbi:serine hydroxymethyltransferase [Candidatus Parvarchaeota archaeon]|nr:serine hydroxymethyltransferase [Candidatus Parvarchaeota archaeon]